MAKKIEKKVERAYDRTPDGRLLYGGDYNPDQWLDRPDILKEDIKLMKEAHVNCVSVGIFSWMALEPEDGVYRMEWLQTVIDNLYENGINTILATPSGAIPPWMAKKYPEVLQTEESGLKRFYGDRHNFCASSPIMRRKIKEIDSRLAKQFGNHPGVIMWHISNEVGGNGRDAQCHCELCQEAFREWLKKKYKTIDQLNKAWWTSFWSHMYSDWSEIHSPTPLGENVLHGLKLDWRRFVNDQTLDFIKEEIKTVRLYSDRPVTTNMMAFYRPFNYMKWAKEFDIISWDNYPDWHSQADELEIAAEISAQHSYFRTMKGKPYLMMESTPSVVNWRPINTLKRPGMNDLASLQAIAHGSNSVQYFQWRQSRGSCEKFHGAVVGHLNGKNTRVFGEVAELGNRLEQISERIVDSCNQAKVAIVFDAENRWAIEDAWAVKHPLDYYGLFLQYYRPLWEKGIDTDVIDMESDLTKYSIVIAPYNYMYRGGYEKRVQKYVENGGIYLTTCWSGIVDENDLCFLDEHPLRALLGIRTEEEDVPGEYWKNSVSYQGKQYEVTGICGLIHAESATVLATYDSDFYAGRPALTVHKSKKGKAYYMAAQCESKFLSDCYDQILKDAGVKCNFKAQRPKGVAVSERICADGTSLYFLQNFNRTESCVMLEDDYIDIESGEKCEKKYQMPAFSCKILQKN